ncbi:G-protein coupled receptor 54-like [Anneissia japonica]|uniref:G-protein coupled receptor 54-like n=1 Tax=Anneissia japonica TaxID=1529436 RepID=UPI001425B34B|nr:G-protein coupled receptor 54-like [Anneissia japonica]XP_033114977.1 G-protein coupled receptor 54-like [Anneissia japonica]XP_033114978.1 G-protein coupled receptor 54-like [Anneissia japonica]
MAEKLYNVPFAMAAADEVGVETAEAYDVYDLLNFTCEDIELSFPPNIKSYLNVFKIVAPLILTVISVIGLLGNAIVLFIIYRYNDMRSVTNFFIGNLATTDITFLVVCTIPTAAVYMGWNPNSAMCRGMNYMMFVTVQATILTLTAMSIDRYQLVVHAVRSRNTRTTKKVLLLDVSAWIASLIIYIPIPVFSYAKAKSCQYECILEFPVDNQKQIFITGSFLMLYAFPLLVILACYLKILIQVWQKKSCGTESAQAQERSIRRKRKITRMVFIVVLMFAVCWAPSHIIIMLETFWSSDFYRTELFELTTSLKLFSLCLSYSNSCCNPIIYAFATDSFKKHFKGIVGMCQKTEFTTVSTNVTPREGDSSPETLL